VFAPRRIAENVKVFTKSDSRNAGVVKQFLGPLGLVARSRRDDYFRMLAIPKLDLRGGSYVGAWLGDRANGAASSKDALDIARSWATAGFHRIHVVDRDAISGTGSNDLLIDDIVRDGALEVQVNDAAESGDQIERLVSAGAVRVVVGPRSLEEPEWLASTADLFPGVLIVSADVRERRVVTRGWVRSLPMAILDVVAELSGLPLGGFLISSPDATRTGSDLALIEDIAEASQAPVIVEGCVHAMSDLRALEHRGVSAVLLGEALCRGELDARGVAMEFGEG
jgi:phosphoribosylformimino-5-aminoimidazole carboxamide ribonucleotide (ProFAR) isomerase